MKIIKFLFIFLFLLVNQLLSFEIKIQILNETKQPQDNLRVILIETKEAQFTDSQGLVEFDVPKEGFYNLRIILNDGRILQPSIQVLGKNQTIVVYTSQPKETPITKDNQQIVGEEGITIIGKKQKQISSVYSVKLEEIKRIPGQFGEALRGIENLPALVPQRLEMANYLCEVPIQIQMPIMLITYRLLTPFT